MTQQLAERIKAAFELDISSATIHYQEIINELLGIVEKQHEALEFYRNIENYLASSNSIGKFEFKTTPVHCDGGSRARQALTLSAPLVGLKVGSI